MRNGQPITFGKEGTEFCVTPAAGASGSEVKAEQRGPARAIVPNDESVVETARVRAIPPIGVGREHHADRGGPQRAGPSYDNLVVSRSNEARPQWTTMSVSLASQLDSGNLDHLQP